MDSILIKLSGEIFSFKKDPNSFIKQIAIQLKTLKKKNKIGLVVGAGNIFRGSQQGKQLNLKQTTAHTVGMIATLINGLILQDILEKESIECKLLSAFNCPQVADVISQEKIDCSLSKNKIVIFAGGTGNTFFTTDTNAVLRALQIEAKEIWKCTKVDGIFSCDPAENKNCELFKKINYKQIIEKNLKFMDLTAITLAQKHNLKIKVFNIFEKNALIKASKDINFGSNVYL